MNKTNKPYVDRIIERYLKTHRKPKTIDWKQIDIEELTPEKIKILNEMVGARNLADFIRRVDPKLYKVIVVLRRNGFLGLLPGGFAWHKDDYKFYVFLNDIDRECIFYRDCNDYIRILKLSFNEILTRR